MSQNLVDNDPTYSVNSFPCNVPSTPPHPLTGITVLNLAVNLPGPLAAARLHALGANVIKVEPPTGDPLNAAAPTYYRELTRGHHVQILDLKTPAGQSDLHKLAADAHILITATRPTAARALGIPQLVQQHRLVHVEIVGFAHPRADHPGHDLTYQAAHGTLLPGVMPTVPIADYLGGERAALAALAGLRAQDQARLSTSSIAEVVPANTTRVTLDDAAAWAAGAMRHGLSTPGGPLGGGLPLYHTYPTADGHIALACLEPHFAHRLTQVVATETTTPPTAQTTGQDATPPTLEAVTLANMFAAKPTAYWVQIAHKYDLPIEAIVMHTKDKNLP